MGLAESVGTNTWRVRRDFAEILRAMQRTSDHQKMLGTHGVLMSDERLPIAVMDWSQTNFVEGRILVHGQEEASGRCHLMLEGTDAKVHLIHYTPEIERARHQGGFRTNSFVRIRRTFDGSEPCLELEDFGNAEDLLHDERRITAMAQQFIKRDIVPIEDGWGGWLGRYQAALRKSALQLMHDAERTQEKRQRERQRSRNRSLGP